VYNIPLIVARFACLLAAGVSLLGCGAESWTPPPPAGVTWQYDYQGFRERKTNVMAGTVGGHGVGVGYGAAFSFRHQSELHGKQEADPFVESTPIDGVRFNEHLQNQGIRVEPAASALGSALPAGRQPPPPANSSGGSSW